MFSAWLMTGAGVFAARRFWLKGSAMGSGTHVGMPMTGHDVALLALIVDSSDDAIVSRTLDGPIASWNGAAERMYGYSAEEIVGKSISLLIPEGSEGMVRILGEIAAGRRVDHYRTTRLRKDGTSVPMFLTVSPNHDRDGAIAEPEQAREGLQRNELGVIDDRDRYHRR